MPSILLVEDSSVQSRAISELLTSANYQVDAVTNGREALDYLAQRQVDVVITDLEMPELDGLSLVRAMHAGGIAIPIILITAHGSEQVAVDALRAGATSYVPKGQLRDLLVSTVNDVLAGRHRHGGYERLLGCVSRSEFEFELDNDPELILPLCDLLQQMIDSVCEFGRCERLRIGVALEQAVHNAMYRGNLEIPGAFVFPPPPGPKPARPPADRRVHVQATIGADVVRFLVRDEGPGFDVTKVRQQGSEGAVSDGQGRGLVLMQAFMDEVSYNARGNELILTKNVPPRAERPPLIRAQKSESVAAGPAASATMTRTRTLGQLKSLDDHETYMLNSRRVIVGRDRSCDVVVPHADVSGHHCQLFLYSGWWYVKDLHTKNGIRINGQHVLRRRLNPGDVLSVAKHRFEIQYDPFDLGAVGPTPPPDPF